MAVASWTDDMVKELKRLWAAGSSASDIADALGGGISRCAVIGKVNRLGLERRRPSSPRKLYTRRIARGRSTKRRPVFTAAPAPPPPLPPPPPELAAPKPRRLQLLQLAEHHCRWPIGDPHRRPFYFCAADKDRGVPYCPHHMAKAFVKTRRA